MIDFSVDSRGDLLRIARSHELGLVVLFGSQATGRARPGSDIDMGLLRRDQRRLSLAQLGAAQLDLRAALGDAVQAADLATDDVIFRLEVIRDGKLLYADQPDRWTSYVARALIDHAELAPFIQACVEAVRRRAQREAAP